MDTLIGNASIKQLLQNMLQQQKVPHALLFFGIEGIGKSLYAQKFAEALTEVSGKYIPDIHHYRPEGKVAMHALHTLNDLSKEIHYPAYSGGWKVFIIHEAHRMLPTSANALLKTFEEPTDKTLIILLTDTIDQLLPTILSRCQKILFKPIKREDIFCYLQKKYTISTLEAEKYASMAQGSLGKAIAVAKQGEDPLKKLIVDALSHKKIDSYLEIIDLVEKIEQSVERRCQLEEEGIKEKKLEGINIKNLSALQREKIDKESQGEVNLLFFKYLEEITEWILAWYRDLLLLEMKGPLSYLYYSDKDLFLQWEVGEGRAKKALENAFMLIKELQLGLERSVKLTFCLETLLIKLSKF